MISLTIRTFDFQTVIQKPYLEQRLRDLTLHEWSGMNSELNFLLSADVPKKPKAKIILAYRLGTLIAWALLSKENSGKFDFTPKDGWIFQVYVSEDYRRQGIASALFQRANKAVKDIICVIPWSDEATSFYDQLPNDRIKYLDY